MVSRRGTIGGLAQRVAAGRMYHDGDRKGVLLMTGWFGTLDYYFDPTLPGSEVLPGLPDSGFMCGSINTLSTWGNSSIRTDMTTLRTNLQANGAASGKVHLYGQSMGGVCCLNWAKANPTLVQSICLVIPTVDIQAIYDANRNGAASSISTAYGGRPADADNPADNAASFTAMPMRIYYSTTDSYTTQAETETFGNAAGANLVSMGAIGHALGTPYSGAAAGRFFLEN